MEKHRTETDPRAETDAHLAWQDQEPSAGRERFEAITMEWAPRADSALLAELLEQELERTEEFPDTSGARLDRNEAAVLHAYRQRLQALRCEYADARQRAIEVEDQLAQARLLIADLETNLQRMRASLWWKARELCAHCWRLISRGLRRSEPG